MTALDIFQYAGQQVRTVIVDGEPWFILNDVCKVLGISNPHNVAARIDSDALRQTEVIDSMGRTQNTNIVDESGLYEVIIRSDSPAAAPFRRWITHQVLPMIRKTGSYGAPAVPDISTPEGILALAQQFTRTAEELVAKKNEVAALAPRAAQADTFRQAEGLRTITDLCNDLKVHAQANFPGLKVKHLDLFDLAGMVGLIIRGNTVRNNQPTARAIEAGWVKPKGTTVDTNSHGSFVKVSARLTPRGYGRLWDAAINNLNTYGQVLPPKKEIAA